MTDLDRYLDEIENTVSALADGRRKAQDELSSLEMMAVESIVAGYHVTSGKDAYIRALSMALVRSGRGLHKFPAG